MPLIWIFCHIRLGYILKLKSTYNIQRKQIGTQGISEYQCNLYVLRYCMRCCFFLTKCKWKTWLLLCHILSFFLLCSLKNDIYQWKFSCFFKILSLQMHRLNKFSWFLKKERKEIESYLSWLWSSYISKDSYAKDSLRIILKMLCRKYLKTIL